jgi:hypothetical protein
MIMPGFDERIFESSECIFGWRRTLVREIIEGDYFEAVGTENRGEKLSFPGVVRGEQNVHLVSLTLNRLGGLE